MFNRKELKKEAKEIAFNNLWDILWPQLLLMLVSSFLGITGIGTIVMLFISPLFQVAYILYIRKIIKGEERNLWELIKSNFPITITLFLVSLLVALFISLGTLLFVIPGVIVGLGLSFVYFVLADDSNLKTMDAIEKTWNLMKGHKKEYFILLVSFILWYLLSLVTFGIGLIWTIPYITITQELYYQYLKNGNNVINIDAHEIIEEKENMEE